MHPPCNPPNTLKECHDYIMILELHNYLLLASQIEMTIYDEHPEGCDRATQARNIYEEYLAEYANQYKGYTKIPVHILREMAYTLACAIEQIYDSLRE